ncbi:MAG: BON domain-containing protein [Betaproteobacteria bacterium]|nr:BON domain-containing protein [Betaproteobacteria bacterium]
MAILVLAACATPEARSPDVLAQDVRILHEVEQGLHDNPRIYDRHIEISVYDGVVKLSGIVFDGNDMNDAVRIASRVPGVKSVKNEMQVQEMGTDRFRRR